MADETNQAQNPEPEPVQGAPVPEPSEEPHGKPEETVDYEAKYREAVGHSRKWEALAKANKTAAAELEALKRESSEEREKLTRRAEEAENELAQVKAMQEVDEWKREAADKYGVPAALLSGDTREAIDAHAKALHAWHDPEPQADPRGIPNMGGAPSGTAKTSTAASFARAVKASGF